MTPSITVRIGGIRENETYALAFWNNEEIQGALNATSSIDLSPLVEKFIGVNDPLEESEVAILQPGNLRTVFASVVRLDLNDVPQLVFGRSLSFSPTRNVDLLIDLRTLVPLRPLGSPTNAREVRHFLMPVQGFSDDTI